MLFFRSGTALHDRARHRLGRARRRGRQRGLKAADIATTGKQDRCAQNNRRSPKPHAPLWAHCCLAMSHTVHHDATKVFTSSSILTFASRPSMHLANIGTPRPPANICFQRSLGFDIRFPSLSLGRLHMPKPLHQKFILRRAAQFARPGAPQFVARTAPQQTRGREHACFPAT